MASREIVQKRKTKETKIELTLDMSSPGSINLHINGLPFLSHLLHAMAFHGGFSLTIQAEGDTDVDPHHLAEDTGIVLGDALLKTVETYGPIRRFGHSVIPMDDALSEAAVDVSGRPYLFTQTDFPQSYSGSFPMYLLDEFLAGLTNRGKMTLHCLCRYGRNSHHMAESLFKALGKALSQAFVLLDKGEAEQSTKGMLQ